MEVLWNKEPELSGKFFRILARKLASRLRNLPPPCMFVLLFKEKDILLIV